VEHSFKGTSLLVVLIIGMLWGMNWPAVKYMLTEIPPLTVRALAFPLAALLLSGIARALGHSLRPAACDRVPILITGLLVVFGFNILSTFGQLHTETSKAAIIAYTMPAFTAVLAVLFLRERLRRRNAIALAIGMMGLAVLASEDLHLLAAKPLGPATMLLAALSWALGNISLKAREWSLSPLALTVWFFAVSSAFCWPLVLLFEPPWQQSWPSGPVLWTLGYHVLGPMVVCYTCWTIIVGRLSATVAAISTLVAPVVGVSSAVILLDDPLTWQKVLALFMVVASIGLTLRPAQLSAR
jgi:drug/metabolite transporter (DMT)-like permease